MFATKKVIALEQRAEKISPLPSPKSRVKSALPEQPLLRISPPKRWRFDFSELRAHQGLFYFLIWRDLKTRYQQTVLGAGWVVLQPLLMTLIFTLFLGQLVAVPTDGVPYSIFAYAGLLPWIFFSNAILSSSHSLINNASLITKVYFPRILLPTAAVIVRLADLCVAAAIFFAVLFYYGFKPSWQMLIFIPLVLELALLALACGLWSSALNVKYRDVGTLLPVILQLWMFTSPIIYPSSIVPEKWRAVYLLNPLAAIIEAMHASLFSHQLDWSSIGFSIVATLSLLLYAAYSFQSAEDDFADVV